MQRDPQAIMFHEEGGISEFKDLDGRNVMAVPGSGWIMLMEKNSASRCRLRRSTSA
jgi:hypothetical protein